MLRQLPPTSPSARSYGSGLKKASISLLLAEKLSMVASLLPYLCPTFHSLSRCFCNFPMALRGNDSTM